MQERGAHIAAALIPKCNLLTKLSFGNQIVMTEEDVLAYLTLKGDPYFCAALKGQVGSLLQQAEVHGGAVLQQMVLQFNQTMASFEGSDRPANGCRLSFGVGHEPRKQCGVVMESSMTEADFSERCLHGMGVSILVAFLPRCTQLTNLNLTANNPGVEAGFAIMTATAI